ncbi:pyridoxamine 5'-phosphate oxidase [Caldilinea sp.]|uniref:pyridoxamine 5'-phosphate oxidase n=1 Tax=Caldilinea sp. TaxID=2293560 RepID=UPI002CB79655|nr:pyridoxamine 5'-phosphate oxidase [Anaerolineales bacterium]HQY90430.1 pyridoxamine 5'-phosphate oxidase [Caldilinea sp.]HRA64759.1 pyridoxamine 5'-phosphate oxidase [Caldilinea sp.]
MSTNMTNFRKEYQYDHLSEENAGADPFALFERWLQLAGESAIHEPNAMALATATPNGRPSIRMVLLKGVDRTGFTFFTNYHSHKGRELAINPFASLLFWWEPLERQVRIEGAIEKLPAAVSDEYYYSRPLGSRLGAWVSQQSKVIPNRAVLDTRLGELQAEYRDKHPDRPPFWGGYRLVPEQFEFWQGGVNRLHDRLRYCRQPDAAWLRERLAP